MEHRVLTVAKDHRGCTVFDNGRALAVYPDEESALDLALLLADATRLRNHRVLVQVSRYGQPPRRLSC